MRWGAALRLVLPAGGVAPRFFVPPLFVPRLFASRPPIRCPHAPPLERMISHVFPWALT